MSGWTKSRSVALGAVIFLLVVAAAAPVFACAGELPDHGAGTTTVPGAIAVLTVEQALAAKEGKELNVQGAVVATGDGTVLASALAESYPPQAGGATLPVAGLDLSTLVGLSSTAGQAGTAAVTWSDYWLVLRGVIKGGVLQVRGVPRVEEDAGVDGVRIRFSPVSEPIRSGDQVWWAFDVTNTGQEPLELVFSDGQRGEVILGQDGVDKYTWSQGKAFTQEVETVTLAPGKSYSVVLNDTLNVPTGDYDLTARVTAMAGPAGSQAPLPDITTTLTVH